MVPVIALVGRPNVGKSTLFNRLTKTRDALVAEIAGLTRDRKYGEGKVGEYPFIVIDTGGISGQEEGIDEAMASQSFQAIKEADIVFFMVDVGAGITAGDRMIADYLRRSGKSAYLIANKIDGKNPDVVLAEFFELGMGEAIPIAAAHNRGITTLIDYVMEKLHPKVEPEEETGYLPDEAERAIEHEQLNIKGTKIAVVGRPNAVSYTHLTLPTKRIV